MRQNSKRRARGQRGDHGRVPASGGAPEQPRVSLYAEVTARIIAELEAGRFPWVQPWSSATAALGLPRNAATGRRYSGINILLLWGAVIERGYLPAGVPLVKRIAAGPGSLVCAVDAAILVDGRPFANRLTHDALARPMPWWRGCRRLGRRDYLLLNPAPTSFDGRYFGRVEASAIIGKAVPLWLR